MELVRSFIMTNKQFAFIFVGVLSDSFPFWLNLNSYSSIKQNVFITAVTLLFFQSQTAHD